MCLCLREGRYKCLCVCLCVCERECVCKRVFACKRECVCIYVPEILFAGMVTFVSTFA